MVADRLAGRLPGVHLNDHGREQSRGIINLLDELRIRAIYSSPLERALETAQPLAEKHRLPILISQDLVEVDYGDWQGRTYKSLKRLPLWKKVLSKPENSGFPNGETFKAVQQRACNEIIRISSSYDKKGVVACFTHGDIIRLALTFFLNMPMIGFHRFVINTGSITVLFFDKDNCPILIHTNISDGLTLKPII